MFALIAADDNETGVWCVGPTYDFVRYSRQMNYLQQELRAFNIVEFNSYEELGDAIEKYTVDTL